MIYVILGQTASGKTNLACKLARKFNIPLINADAFQVYDKLDIGSAKPSKEELDGIEYHMISNISLETNYNVKLYQQEVRKLLDGYLLENRDVILSGGSFLYVKAALFNYVFTSENEDLNLEFEKYNIEELQKILYDIDPKSYENIDINNKRRLVRAIVLAKQGNPIYQNKNGDELIYPAKFFNIDISTQEINSRIDIRVEKMFELGLLDEVKSLLKNYPKDIQAFKAIGYKEIIAGLNDNLSKEDMIKQVQQNTRQYAKRQRTFLRHQFPNIITLSSQDIYNYICIDIERKIRNRASISSCVLSKLEKMKIAVVGLGGVGSIVSTSLIRLGAFKLVLIDKDKIEASNLNRQIVYNSLDIGLDKVNACKEHLLKIDPYAQIVALNKEVEVDDISNCDFVFDCIDDVNSKAIIAKYCLENNIGFISATGTGLRKDASKIKIGTLDMIGEPLAKAYKKALKEIEITDFSSINVAYSTEQASKRLTSYIGSNVLVPNSLGLSLVSFFINYLN